MCKNWSSYIEQQRSWNHGPARGHILKYSYLLETSQYSKTGLVFLLLVFFFFSYNRFNSLFVLVPQTSGARSVILFFFFIRYHHPALNTVFILNTILMSSAMCKKKKLDFRWFLFRFLFIIRFSLLFPSLKFKRTFSGVTFIIFLTLWFPRTHTHAIVYKWAFILYLEEKYHLIWRRRKFPIWFELLKNLDFLLPLLMTAKFLLFWHMIYLRTKLNWCNIKY